MKIIENFPEILISFLLSPPPSEWLLIAKIVFIAVSLFLAGVIVFGLLKSSWPKLYFLDNAIEFLNYKPVGVKKIEKDWRKIMAKLNTGLESEYKLAIIETDNMANEILKRMEFEGETLGEKLDKLNPVVISNIEELREAHKIRNNIIHDPNYKLSLDETKKMLEIYERAFRDLNIF